MSEPSYAGKADWIRVATEENWDGYKGHPTTRDAIYTATKIIGIPMGDGGLQIELYAGGAEIEIVIAPDGKVAEITSRRADFRS